MNLAKSINLHAALLFIWALALPPIYGFLGWDASIALWCSGAAFGTGWFCIILGWSLSRGHLMQTPITVFGKEHLHAGTSITYKADPLAVPAPCLDCQTSVRVVDSTCQDCKGSRCAKCCRERGPQP